ncbi:hypothetical protein GYMLUDRAFT_40163 [Collybiopsis luxurians FD-317 M1]|uniref:ATP-dependent RNA helicase n=1 Tax=Collybiopsis luxurians FD-317 M1 TaxID=944289 RepID=A0A0D0CLS0_9AGAR|nr:hypothetical protein GYMLUDRAFT_40163 [Collybiopsis luxurians FD-317 M1]
MSRKKARFSKSSSLSTVADTAGLPEATASSSEAPRNSSHLTTKKFQDLPISLQLKQRIQHEFMTEVQAVTIGPALAGQDLLVQAKTGTGKTIGFLLPAIEKLFQSSAPRKGTAILVLSPTRELAQQISKEAQTLLPAPQFSIATVIGGTSNPKKDLEKFLESDSVVVVATPGRLHDYFTGERKNEVLAKFTGLQSLILDEVDRLLDGGFARELDGVIKTLPKTQRQTLFFSATISENIKEIAKGYNNGSKYLFISTLKEDEMNTHRHVHQSYIITPFDKHIPTVLALLHLDSVKHALDHVTTSTPSLSPGRLAPTTQSKVMVFFPTARHAGFAAEVLSAESIRRSLPSVFEVHSRISQSKRTKATEAFRDASNAIMLCSDVSARGLDVPGVTLVIQVGLPSSAEQYVHRLGRTARAGAEGQGIIVLDPVEQSFLSSHAMRKITTVTPHMVSSNSHEAKELATYTETYSQHVNAILDTVASRELSTVERAYSAWLGYYKGQAKTTKWSSEQLVEEATRYAKDVLGWKQDLPPPLSPKIIGRMGLKGVKGLNVDRSR